jgi:hypothetical protein
MVNANGLTPYLASFGFRPRIPRCSTPSAPYDERLHNLQVARRWLIERDIERKEQYKAKESPKATSLEPGTFVSLRTLQPTKGEPKWQPGYLVVKSHGAALKVRHLESKRQYRVNQKDVRVIPEALPYEEVDPLPSVRRATNTGDLPVKASPLPPSDESTVLTPVRIPAAEGREA